MRVLNPVFEACRDPQHAYYMRSCDLGCPDRSECSRGEFIEIETEEELIFNIFRRLTLEEKLRILNKMTKELLEGLL